MSFWCLHFLPKNERKQVDKYIVKSNLFVRFLEKTSAWKNHFEYVWPLLTANVILKLVIYVEYEIISTRQNYEKQNWMYDREFHSLFLARRRYQNMFDDGPRLSIVLAVKKLVRYYLIYDHEFTSLILPTLKYQSILHVRNWTSFLSSACRQKTRQIPHCICYRYSNSKIVVIPLHRHYRPETTSKPQPSRWPLLTEAGTPTTWPIRKVCQFSRCTGRRRRSPRLGVNHFDTKVLMDSEVEFIFHWLRPRFS